MPCYGTCVQRFRVSTGGEDSFFIATTDRVFGVADGVSGWASVGVDPADFARQLMRCTRAICERSAAVKNAVLDPQRILEEAYEQSKHIVGTLPGGQRSCARIHVGHAIL